MISLDKERTKEIERRVFDLHLAIAAALLIAISGCSALSSRAVNQDVLTQDGSHLHQAPIVNDSGSTPPVRIPAEWERHKATWMQWPRAEEAGLRRNFSAIIAALRKYEPINILIESNAARRQAEILLTEHGVPLSRITWHIMPYDWAWMRDNGPVWSVKSDEEIVQNWGFNGWGLGPPYADDDAVPGRVAAIEGVPCETYVMINERGNLEFNGAGSLIANWVCQSNRNPGVSRAETETIFRRAFGLTRIVWLLSEPSDDITNGHVDGIARFIDEDTVAVARYVSQTDPDAPVYEEAAAIIENAGFEIVRVDIPGYVIHNGDPLPANYMNWLTANGVVIVPGFGVPAWDAAAQTTIAGFFPNRDIVMVEILDIWAEGGGVHCVTNDQPVSPTTSSATDSVCLRNIWNAWEVAGSLGVTYHTVQRYVDILEQAFPVRYLQPWFSNIGKRLVKRPKKRTRFADGGQSLPGKLFPVGKIFNTAAELRHNKNPGQFDLVSVDGLWAIRGVSRI